MKILIDDFIQYSDAPDTLKSPELSEITESNSFTIDLGSSKNIDCIGIGYTDATVLIINSQSINFIENGLYQINSLTAQVLTITHNGTFIGRLAVGKYREIKTSPSKEVGFYTTNNPRLTASGQIIAGSGGVSGRKINIDSRYKIDDIIYQDFTDAMSTQIGKNYPLFIDFDKENFKIPFRYFYGSLDKNALTFQNSINRFLYSVRFNFTERF